MLTPVGNYHHHRLPKLGEIVTVQIPRTGAPYRYPPYHLHRYRRFIVESFPLCDNVLPYSIGIHTVNLRALDNGETHRVSGFWCEAVS